MASLRDYFNNDFPLGMTLNISHKKNFQLVNEYKRNIGFEYQHIEEHVHLHGPTSTRLHTFYIPESKNTLCLIFNILTNIGNYDSSVLNLEILSGFTGDDEAGLKRSTTTSRVYLYCESELTNKELERLDKVAKRLQLFITIRSKRYFEAKMKIEKPRAFISHDSKDKEIIARPIAAGLSKRLCTVWYDEYSLKIGDSLRDSIEKGIKEAKKCILLITPNFLVNSGWTKTEFNSIFTRELLFNEKVILPIWSSVSARDVYEYSPSLADTFALTWPHSKNKSEMKYQEETEEIISRIHMALS